MRLQLCTWPAVETYLEASTGIIVPIGSTEQHGPSGLIGTDALCAEAIAIGAGERTGAMVGPAIPIGMAVHHMAFAGSMTYRPSTLIAVVRDYVMALTAHGFRRFLFVNGHGGNIPTLQSAWYEVHAELRQSGHPAAGDLRFGLQNWWAGAQVKAYADEAFGAAEGSHATCTEISLMQYLYPEDAPVLEGPLEPAIAPHHVFHGADHYRAVHPDGRIGSDPSLASADHGGRLFDIAVMEAVASYEALTKSAAQA